MNRSMMYAVALLAVLPAAGTSQELNYARYSGGYGALGFGGGNFSLDCDSGCGNPEFSSAGVSLTLGRHISRRIRPEIGFQYQSNREYAANAFSASLGASVYLIENLHVRGAVSYLRVSMDDSTGTYEATGGPGFVVGAGYDLFLGRSFALTPYVNMTTGSLSQIDVSGAGSGTTSGTLNALNFGVALGRIRGTWWCTTAEGVRVQVAPRYRRQAEACLAQVERRIGRRPAAKF